jgi:membrane associated rhomboid family serine protease
MLPIGDSIATHRTAWVVRALVVANVAVFAYELWLGRRVEPFIAQWGVTPALVTRAIGGDVRASSEVWWTLITSQFLHAGFLHLAGNMLFLWIFGDNVEDRLGSPMFLGFYLCCGSLASLVQVWVDPASRLPMIGASGAIAGVLGAYFVMYPGSWVTVLVPLVFFLLPVPIPAFALLAVWFATQFVSGVASIVETQASGGVAFWAHVGGFVAGLALIAVLPKSTAPPSGGPPRPRRIAPASKRSRSLAGSLVALASNLVMALLLIRFLVILIDLRAAGMIGAARRSILEWSGPLVLPFADFIPAVRFDGYTVELYTLAALVVYYLALSLLASLLGSRRP